MLRHLLLRAVLVFVGFMTKGMYRYDALLYRFEREPKVVLR